MGKFDTIDIFFIALISAYFITLGCLILTLVILKIHKIFLNSKKKVTTKEEVFLLDNKEQDSREELKDELENKNNIKKPKVEKKPNIKKVKEKPKKEIKLQDNPVIQKLFMKEVKKTDVKENINKEKTKNSNAIKKVNKQNNKKSSNNKSNSKNNNSKGNKNKKKTTKNNSKANTNKNRKKSKNKGKTNKKR